ncbi:hypothetical protein I302_102977 [Kwoniella bestiolae CBS 10118]|uniref:Uncharacterized protein n=1 Tax=Kwoniella bestiolae CBS 10118 TaxID=1296100 RepID=A0A1B9GGH0_9TREE|nr:hypothetical protein I302_01673 [Kwoniella bestiolae CBS 10118]OCF30154.1 hypothetical protein I302_01673 [Kwoniella bestiolae CBS 10118]
MVEASENTTNTTEGQGQNQDQTYSLEELFQWSDFCIGDLESQAISEHGTTKADLSSGTNNVDSKSAKPDRGIFAIDLSMDLALQVDKDVLTIITKIPRSTGKGQVSQTVQVNVEAQGKLCNWSHVCLDEPSVHAVQQRCVGLRKDTTTIMRAYNELAHSTSTLPSSHTHFA